jgi:hypothetical protein
MLWLESVQLKEGEYQEVYVVFSSRFENGGGQPSGITVD